MLVGTIRPADRRRPHAVQGRPRRAICHLCDLRRTDRRSWLQLWLQFGPSAAVRTRSWSSIRARQPAYETAADYCERDHDGLQCGGPRSGERCDRRPAGPLSDLESIRQGSVYATLFRRSNAAELADTKQQLGSRTSADDHVGPTLANGKLAAQAGDSSTINGVAPRWEPSASTCRQPWTRSSNSDGRRSVRRWSARCSPTGERCSVRWPRCRRRGGCWTGAMPTYQR
jgi:hypothetical protein